MKEVITAGEQLQITLPLIKLFKGLTRSTFSKSLWSLQKRMLFTSYTLNNNPDSWVKYTPIGKPVYNTQMYILILSLKPVPVVIPEIVHWRNSASVRLI